MVLRHMPRRSGGRKGGAAIRVIMLAAFILLILGWIGLFFGRLIQAAVSRKRESLADASAVQFTRDPQGLRGALVKIGALGVGSRFSDTDAEEVAHMLFAPGLARAFATHPPLEERIREIDPRFDPKEFDDMRLRMNQEREQAAEEAARSQPAPAERLTGLLDGAIVLAPAAVAQPPAPEQEVWCPFLLGDEELGAHARRPLGVLTADDDHLVRLTDPAAHSLAPDVSDR